MHGTLEIFASEYPGIFSGGYPGIVFQVGILEIFSSGYPWPVGIKGRGLLVSGEGGSWWKSFSDGHPGLFCSLIVNPFQGNIPFQK